MWSWIPFIGPFIQAGVNAFGKWQDATVQKAQIAANKEVADGAQDVQVIGIRADLAKTFAHDIGTVLARDVLLNWYTIYVSLIFWDSCFRNALPAGWTWRVLALPTSLNVLCSAIVAWLFVTAWRGKP